MNTLLYSTDPVMWYFFLFVVSSFLAIMSGILLEMALERTERGFGYGRLTIVILTVAALVAFRHLGSLPAWFTNVAMAAAAIGFALAVWDSRERDTKASETLTIFIAYPVVFFFGWMAMSGIAAILACLAGIEKIFSGPKKRPHCPT